jgi:hypothetical protein
MELRDSAGTHRRPSAESKENGGSDEGLEIHPKAHAVLSPIQSPLL